MRSEFDLNKYIKQMDDKGTYLCMDNGHMNQKKQPFGRNTGLSLKKSGPKITPGPGSYETNNSSVVNSQLSKKLML
jgi:hypothetical protein